MHYSPGLQLNRKADLAERLLSSENVRRFLLLFVVLVSTLVVRTISAANREPLQRPNVILVVAEEFGYGDLGVNGQTHFKTPRLDQFASDGLRFTNYYLSLIHI